MALCRAFEPEVVGLQCNFTTERFRTRRLVERVRRELPRAFVVIGGHDASREPEWFSILPVDAVAVGDGEEVMLPLVDALERGADLRKVAGLVLTAGGTLHRTPAAPFRDDLDTLPMPARHLISRYAPNYYINFRKPLALMETARGCPFKCNFCSVWKFHESTFREKSPERVVAELQAIEAPNVFITDDIFWIDVRRGEELARQIKAAGIKKYFTVQTRTDIICKFPHLIEMWKDCGSPRHLPRPRVGHRRGARRGQQEQHRGEQRAGPGDPQGAGRRLHAELHRRPGLGPRGLRPPARLDRRAPAPTTAASRCSTPLPGTDLWETARHQVTTHDWEMYDIVHAVLPTKLSLEEFYEEYSRLWRHALEVRYRHRGKVRTYVQLGAALATGKVTLSAPCARGMNIAKVFSKPETFLEAHQKSEAAA